MLFRSNKDDCWRYTIESSEGYCETTDDVEEARSMVASALREVRSAYHEQVNDSARDQAQDVLDSLHEAGKAALVLNALRNAGLV